jgi:hypothetical protein
MNAQVSRAWGLSPPVRLVSHSPLRVRRNDLTGIRRGRSCTVARLRIYPWSLVVPCKCNPMMQPDLHYEGLVSNCQRPAEGVEVIEKTLGPAYGMRG